MDVHPQNLWEEDSYNEVENLDLFFIIDNNEKMIIMTNLFQRFCDIFPKCYYISDLICI